MQCSECELEMRVDKVEEGVIYYECKKCGKQFTKTIKELEEEE